MKWELVFKQKVNSNYSMTYKSGEWVISRPKVGVFILRKIGFSDYLLEATTLTLAKIEAKKVIDEELYNED